MKTTLFALFVIGIIGSSGILFAQEPIDPALYRDGKIGKTLSNPEIAVIIESLGAILIVLFIIFYAIKKRKAKKDSSETR